MVDLTILSPMGLVLAHALWQGLLIWVFVALALQWTPEEFPQRRYLIATLGLALLPVSSGFTFLYYLNQLSFETVQYSYSPYVPESSFIAHLIFYLGIIWAIGSLFFFVRLIQKHLQVQNLKQNGIHPPAPKWARHFEDLRQRLQLPKKITFFESSLLSCPAVIGCFSPVVLFPLGMMSGLTTNEVRAILAHELAHLKRYDQYVNLIQEIIEALFFYHPVTWWLSAKMRAEREYCCDKIAVEITGNPIALAKSLAYLESFRQISAPGLTAGGGLLSGRIYRLLNSVSNQQHSQKTQSLKTNKLMKTISFTSLILLFIVALSYSDKATQKEVIPPQSDSVVSAADIPKPPNWITQTQPPTSSKATSENSTISLETRFIEIDIQHLELLKNTTPHRGTSQKMEIYSEAKLKQLLVKLSSQTATDFLTMPTMMMEDSKVGSLKIGNQQKEAPVHTGITSSFLPKISNSDESIDLKFFAQVTGSSGQNITDYTCTTFQEEANIPAGYAGIIAGPVVTRSQVVKDKVPILGDIPFLGRLFQESNVITNNTVILMTVLPTVSSGSHTQTNHQL